MMLRSSLNVAALLFTIALPMFPSAWCQSTALDDYIAQEDPSYSWTLHSATPFSLGTIYNVDLVSQTWRGPADVNRHVWQHRLNIAVPVNRNSRVALLIVESGSNSSLPMDISDYAFVSYLAGCTVALLQTVPNQPLRFYNPNTSNLSEDNAIAHTYDRYLNLWEEDAPHPDPSWPLLLPMVKSAVKAMDATQECLAEHASMNIQRFVVAGASKRGWTTWLTAAVDNRVAAIVPLVIDILGMGRQIDHHKNAYSSLPANSSTYFMYGGYSTAIRPYTERTIFERLHTPEGRDLMQVVDPYSYLDRLTMPKLIINSTGDEFFLPDGIKFYGHHLPGKNYLLYMPNSDHSLGIDANNLDMLVGLFNFLKSVYLSSYSMPTYAWNFEQDGSIRVTSEEPPASVSLWQAYTPEHRDFRLRTMGPLWQRSPLTTQDESGAFIASVPTPETGWVGFFVQLDYEDGTTLCSGIRVLPDTYANDAEVPDIFGPQFNLIDVQPSLARAGVEVSITVDASEELAGEATLDVNGVPATLLSQDGSRHMFSYTVQQSDMNGPALLHCYGRDVWNNPGVSQFSHELIIDTTPPEIVQLSIVPNTARPGDTVIIEFSVSEILLVDPVVTVNGRHAALMPTKGMEYAFVYTVDAEDAPGTALVTVLLMDIAENIAEITLESDLMIMAPLPLFTLTAVVALLLVTLLFRKRFTLIRRRTR